MKNKALLLIDNINNINKYNYVLSSERKKKADRYKFDADKKRCMLAEFLLRDALAQFGYKCDDEIYYIFNEHEKPYLRDCKDVYFSISHSGDYVACIVSNVEVGIDIEKITDIDLNIAKRFFAKGEYEMILAFENAKDKLDAFYRIWTKKEAYIKMTGKGFSGGFETFDTCSKGFAYKFQELDLVPEYKCSICSKEVIDAGFSLRFMEAN